MTTRQKAVCWAVAAALAFAALAIYAANRRYRFLAAKPAWLDPQQPPEGIAATYGTLTPAESWAANRASHLSACCTDRGAGRRIRRTYPATLADSDGSFIRASFNLGGC
jgi:hypothetical protein